MDDMNCTESDTDIRLCRKEMVMTNCQPSETANVICKSKYAFQLPLRHYVECYEASGCGVFHIVRSDSNSE